MLSDEDLPHPLPEDKTSSQLSVGSHYSDEELEFLKTLERYKRLRQRPWPNCREVLMVLKAMGYRKPTEEPRGCPTPGQCSCLPLG